MKRCYIIAEAGVNHDGDVAKAIQLIDIAVAAKADAVKFQLFSPDDLVTKTAATADYQASNLGDHNVSQYDMLSKLALGVEAMKTLYDYATKRAIDFLCTPFDEKSLSSLLAHTRMRYVKLASGDITNAPLLLKAARSGLPLIVSTGMSNLSEVGEALSVIHYGLNHPDGYPSSTRQPTVQKLKDLQNRVTLLHCISHYPAPMESLNLRAMHTLAGHFKLAIGFSDHSSGIHAAVAAVALGATVVEKHFTYDQRAAGPDHAASLSPEELSGMVSAIRNIERAMGDGIKECQSVELGTRQVARRGIVAARFIARGELFSSDNLACKRPMAELSPMKLGCLLGKRAQRDYAADTMIQSDELL